MGHMIDLKAADGTTFPAYVAEPSGKPKGGVVVLQEIFGVNCTSAPWPTATQPTATSWWRPPRSTGCKPGVELGYTEADMGTGFGFKTAVDGLPAPGVMADIQAAIDHAATSRQGRHRRLLLGRPAHLARGLHAAGPLGRRAVLRWRHDGSR